MKPDPIPHPMTRAEYRRWLETQPERPRYELVSGEPIAMVPERLGHARTKARVWRALDAAITAAGLDCEAIADGIAVPISDDTEFEPDTVVQCGPPIPDDETDATSPVIIVEVLSPSTKHIDTGLKLSGYFTLPSVRHYLIVRTDRRMVIHHRRAGPDGPIATNLLSGGRLDLDPPGLSVDLADFFAR